MSNELVTKFIFDDAEADRRIDLTEKRLVNFDKLLNSFGLNPTFGKGISSQFDALGKKVNQFEANLKKLGSTDFKALGNDLLKQAQIEKVLEQTKRATVQTLTEEVKLERQKLGLQRDQLKTQQQALSSKNKSDPLLKAALAEVKNYQQETIKREREVTKSIEREAKLQSDARARAAKKTANDFISSLNPPAGGGGSFGDSFINRVGGSAFSGGLSGGVIGGLAGGAVLAGVSLLKSGVSELAGTIEDLSVKSVTLAGNFEETTNAVAVFAGGTANARRELAAIDKIALNTPGLKLEVAEVGYQRLRALNFEAKLSQDLIKGLGTQRVLSGASSDAVDRVITNLIQLKSGAGTAADVRQTIGQLPTLLPVFQRAFGTQDFGDINKAFKTDPQALQKFAAELAKTQSAQAGLNVSIEKGSDAVLQAERAFGQPILDPLTKDIQGLTKLLNENESTFARWGQSAADALRGVSEAAGAIGGSQGGGVAGRVLGAGARGSLAVGTYGVSEGIIRGFQTFSELGKRSREKQEAEDANKSFSELVNKNGGIEGKSAAGLVAGAVGAINEAVLKIPSLNKQLETEEAKKEAEKLAENIRKVSGEIAELKVKSQIDTGSQNLEISKAIAVRDAKGDGLKIARDTAALEIANLQQQIVLSDKLLAARTQNLSSDDFKAGKGLLLSKENEAGVNKLNSQILLTNINLQKQINDEIKKGTDKVKELGKAYQSTFDDLFVKTSRDNPFASIFSESDRAVDKLRENLKGLSPELKAIAEQLQQKADSNKLFETRIDNSLGVFGLRDEANNFRNPQTDSLVEKKRFDEIIQQSISQGNFFNGTFGNFASDLSNKAGGFDKLTDGQKRDIFEVSTLSNVKNNGLDPNNFVGFLAGERRRAREGDNPDLTLQERLQKQIDIVGGAGAKTDEEKSIADRKLIALTQGLDPAKLTGQENDVAASSREREAVRRENAEKDANADRKKQIELQTRIAENQEKLLKIAEKEGLSGIEKLLVEIKDSPTTKSTVQRANPSDTAKQMDLSGTYFEQSRK